jgi:hypothetical protein
MRTNAKMRFVAERASSQTWGDIRVTIRRPRSQLDRVLTFVAHGSVIGPSVMRIAICKRARQFARRGAGVDDPSQDQPRLQLMQQ